MTGSFVYCLAGVDAFGKKKQKCNVVKITGEDILVKEPKTAAGDRYVYFSLEMASLIISGRADVATASGILGHA